MMPESICPAPTTTFMGAPMASPRVLFVISVPEFDFEGQGLEVSKRGLEIGDEIVPILQADRESNPTRLQTP